MADEAETVEQLRAEVRRLQERDAASQAEIAGLRAEAEQRDGALARALEQQTALGEVLRVIASSPHDLRTVLATIAQSAARLTSASSFGLSSRTPPGFFSHPPPPATACRTSAAGLSPCAGMVATARYL